MPTRTTKQPTSSKPAKTPAASKTASKPTAARATTSSRRSRKPVVAAVPPPEPEPAQAEANHWRRIDLHNHTLGSHDYEQPEVGYLDILKQAEQRGLDIIAFTDHNTVNGYRHMQREIADLELLERLGRIRPDELGRLSEYRRLLAKILVLPGFEFTATFGFHILGIFPPTKPIREIEHVLLELRVPSRVIDAGLTEAGATSDVLMAYRAIDDAGGLAIAAHANSSSGVSMRNLNLGGQTRIAFTQDPHLHAIEFTDLDKGRHSSGRLFTGIRPEYPRRMHLLQGSDAHRVIADPKNEKRLGIGDRVTEVWLEEVSFDALKRHFLSNDFDKTRPVFTPYQPQVDPVRVAREAGAGPTRAFHAGVPKRGDRFAAIVQDACGMANAQGGTVYIGCEPGVAKKAPGVTGAEALASDLAAALAERIAPSLAASADVVRSGGVSIVRVTVPQSAGAPHTADGNIVTRDGDGTRTATRDEVVAMVRRAIEAELAEREQAKATAAHPQHGQSRRQQDGRGHEPRQPGQPRHGQPQQQPQPRQQQGQGQPPQQPQSQPRPHRDGGHAREQAPREAAPHRDASAAREAASPREVEAPRDQQPSRRDQQPQRREGQPQHRGGRQREERPAVSRDRSAVEPVVTAPAAASEPQPAPPPAITTVAPQAPAIESPAPEPAGPPVPPIFDGAPNTGVQIAAVEVRDGIRYFTVRDLRKRTLVRNVTIKSARDLWHYAVTKTTTNSYVPERIAWQGDRALLGSAERGGKLRHDFAMRNDQGDVQIYFGVTDDGMDAGWRSLLPAGDAPSSVHDGDDAEDAGQPE